MKKIGIVVVTYSLNPIALYNSIANSSHIIRWYVHHHGDISKVEGIKNTYATANADLHFHLTNRGLAKSWNEGVLASQDDRNDITMIINDDIEFIDQGFDKFIEYVVNHEGLGLTFLMGEEPDSEGNLVTRSQDFACFAIGENALEKVGAFDENFVPAYFEDSDYFHRCQKSDVSWAICDQVLVKHQRSQTLKNNIEIQEQIDVIFLKNQAYMIRKWGDRLTAETTHLFPFNVDKFNYKIAWEHRGNPYPDFRA